MKERNEGILTGFGLGVFTTILLFVFIFGGLSSGGVPFPLTANTNYGMTLSIYHQQNGTLQISTDKAWIPSFTMQGNDDFGTPLGDCKIITLVINGFHIQYDTRTYVINPDSIGCGP